MPSWWEVGNYRSMRIRDICEDFGHVADLANSLGHVADQASHRVRIHADVASTVFRSNHSIALEAQHEK